MSLRLTLICTALALISAAASAQTPATATPRVDARQDKQERRIEQGVGSGELTARETLRVEREQKRIATVEAKAEGDGKVTARERARLHHLQNQASRDIRRQKHDAQVVPAGK